MGPIWGIRGCSVTEISEVGFAVASRSRIHYVAHLGKPFKVSVPSCWIIVDRN